MPPNSSISFPSLQPSVVASVGSGADWCLAEKLTSDQVDFLEIRADLLLENHRQLPGKISELPLPAILTVRAPSEGGRASADPAERREVYDRFLPQVAALDLELASAESMAQVVDQARELGVKCIFSFHDFEKTPPRSILQKMAADAKNRGADLFKVATTTNSAPQLAELMHFLEETDSPLAVMGMGRLGKISRPLLAQLGSLLNYGSLDAPLVSGQWPARDLRRLLNSLAE